MASPYDPSIPGVEPAPPLDEEADPRASLVRYAIGGRVYDAVHHRSCGTCTHPARALIEEKVLLNYSYAAIAEMFSEREVEGPEGFIRLPRVGWESIRNHYKRKHMPLEHAAARKIVDARAEQLGQGMTEAAERVVHHRDVLQTIVERGHDLLQKNQVEIDTGDIISAAKAIAAIDERVGTDQVDADAWSNAMQTIFETARRIMPPALWAQFTRELNKNPVLRALESKDDIVDAEVVPE